MIKTSIVDNGIDITESTTFREYPSKINNILNQFDDELDTIIGGDLSPSEPGKTIIPTTNEQLAIAGGVLAGDDIKVAGDANLKSENIAEGVSIFGVAGTHAGGGISEVRGIYLSNDVNYSLSIEPPTNNIIYFSGDYFSNSYNDIVIVGKGQTVTVGPVNYSLSSDGATFLRAGPSGGGGSRIVYALIALD